MTGTALRQARLGKGIRQNFLADRLEMQAASLYRIEGYDKPLKLTYGQWMQIKDTLNLDDIQMGAYE